MLVAEEAIIDLPDLEFKGKSWQSVRTALNRATKDGITYREGQLAEMPRGLLTQVRAISELWVSDKGLPEMGFTLGGVDEALDPDTQGRAGRRRRHDGPRRDLVAARPLRRR